MGERMTPREAVATGVEKLLPGIHKIPLPGVPLEQIRNISLDEACQLFPDQVGEIVGKLKSQDKIVILGPAIAGLVLFVASHSDLLGGIADTELVRSSREKLTGIQEGIRSKLKNSGENP